MQHITSTPLAAQAGAIAAAIRAEANHQALKAGMVAALHALILSALARLVARLEDLVQLWQAGLLPTPQVAAPRRTTVDATSASPPRAPLRHLRHTRHPSPAREPLEGPAVCHRVITAARPPAAPHPVFAACFSAACRALAPDFSFFGLQASTPTHVYNITIS